MADDFSLTPELDSAQDIPKTWFKDQIDAAINRGLNLMPKSSQFAGNAGRPYVVDTLESGITINNPMNLGEQTIRGYLTYVPDTFTDQTLTITSDNSDDYCGGVVVFDRATAQSLVINSSTPDGFCMGIAMKGAGQLTVTAGAGLTLVNRSSHNKSAGQYARLQVEVIGANVWLSGDTAA